MFPQTNKDTSLPKIKHILAAQTLSQHSAERGGSSKQLLLIFLDDHLTHSGTEHPQGWWPEVKHGQQGLSWPLFFHVSQPSCLDGVVQTFVLTPSSLCCRRAGPGQSGHHDLSYRSRQRWCLWPPPNLISVLGFPLNAINMTPRKLWSWDGAVAANSLELWVLAPSVPLELPGGSCQSCLRL